MSIKTDIAFYAKAALTVGITGITFILTYLKMSFSGVEVFPASYLSAD